MNAPVAAQATEVAKIEAALDRLVTAAIQNRREPSLDPSKDRLVGAAELMAGFQDSLTWTKAQREADELLERPLSATIRRGIRTLGKRLNEIGGWELMTDVCDRVSAADPREEGRRASIIDHRWDGIGSWHS